MSNFITRRFVIDVRNVYFINNGFITKRDILKIISGSNNVYSRLMNTGENVGWCTNNKWLMLTDDDKIFRVGSDIIINLMQYPTTTMNSDGSGVLSIRYDADIYTDEVLKVNGDYKNKRESSTFSFGVVPKAAFENTMGCVFIQDAYSIYDVQEGCIFKTPILDYIANNGDSWREKLINSDQHTGFILDDKDVFLRVTENAIERISMSKWDPIIRHDKTVVSMKSTPTSDYLIVSYSTTAFPDLDLQPNTDYKK